MLNPTDGKNSSLKLPGVDIFLNPAKENEKRRIVDAKQGIAKAYFNSSKMADLYPNLFRILWQSTLPCFKVNMILSVFHIHALLKICLQIRRMGWMISFCLTASLPAQRLKFSMLIHSSFEG